MDGDAGDDDSARSGDVATGTAGGVRERIEEVVSIGRAVAERAQAAEVTFLAAAVAYYAFLSLLPALLLVLALASSAGGAELGDALVAASGDLLTPAGQDLVRDALGSATGRSGATVIGVVVLLWSMLKVFRGLKIAFLKVYGVEEASSLVDQVRDGVTVVVGMGLALGVMFGLGSLLAIADVAPVVDLLGIALLPLVLTAVFLPIYHVFPDVSVTVREVLPGTVFAAVGWTLLQAGFQVYAAGAARYHTYGLLGGVLLLVTWFYLAAVVLLLGGVVNAVLAGRKAPGPEVAGIGATLGAGPSGPGSTPAFAARAPADSSDTDDAGQAESDHDRTAASSAADGAGGGTDPVQPDDAGAADR